MLGQLHRALLQHVFQRLDPRPRLLDALLALERRVAQLRRLLSPHSQQHVVRRDLGPNPLELTPHRFALAEQVGVSRGRGARAPLGPDFAIRWLHLLSKILVVVVIIVIVPVIYLLVLFRIYRIVLPSPTLDRLAPSGLFLGCRSCGTRPGGAGSGTAVPGGILIIARDFALVVIRILGRRRVKCTRNRIIFVATTWLCRGSSGSWLFGATRTLDCIIVIVVSVAARRA